MFINIDICQYVMEIKILGTGCPNCIRLEANVNSVLKELEKKADIIKVTDIEEIMSYGVMSTPALVIDNKLVSYGKINSVEEIKEMIK